MEQTSPQYDGTFDGLQMWFKHLFEKFGWMAVCNPRTASNKLTCYVHSVKAFVQACTSASDRYQENDRKVDIESMKENASKLLKFIADSGLQDTSMTGGKKRAGSKSKKGSKAKKMGSKTKKGSKAKKMW